MEEKGGKNEEKLVTQSTVQQKPEDSQYPRIRTERQPITEKRCESSPCANMVSFNARLSQSD